MWPLILSQAAWPGARGSRHPKSIKRRQALGLRPICSRPIEQSKSRRQAQIQGLRKESPCLTARTVMLCHEGTLPGRSDV